MESGKQKQLHEKQENRNIKDEWTDEPLSQQNNYIKTNLVIGKKYREGVGRDR